MKVKLITKTLTIDTVHFRLLKDKNMWALKWLLLQDVSVACHHTNLRH